MFQSAHRGAKYSYYDYVLTSLRKVNLVTLKTTSSRQSEVDAGVTCTLTLNLLAPTTVGARINP